MCAVIRKVAGVVIRDRKLLLVRKRGTSVFLSPGGKPEAGETPLQALARELREETGLVLTGTTPMGQFGGRSALGDETILIDVYHADVLGTPGPGAEIEELLWVGGDYARRGVEVGSVFAREVIPALVRDGLLDDSVAGGELTGNRHSGPWAAGCDAAALHPQIGALWGAPGRSYYREANALKAQIRTGLKRSLGGPHELFLAGNTSSGLVAALLGVMLRGHRLPQLLNRPYPPYEKVLGFTAAAGGRFAFVTHISPLTGEVRALRSGPEAALVVDAAQSLGTLFQAEVVNSAAVFVGPLHKHWNLVPGLGIVGVDFDAVGDAGEGLRTALEVLEHGTTNLSVLQACVRRLAEMGGGPAVNRARIAVGSQLQSAADELGLRVLTPAGVQAHIASFTTRDGSAVENVIDADRIGARVFARDNILRISLHSDVHGVGSPEDYEVFVAAALRHAAGPRRRAI